MARTTLDLDERLLEDLVRESGKNKTAALEEAAREYIRARRRARLVERIKSGEFHMDLTMEELRRMRGCE